MSRKLKFPFPRAYEGRPDSWKDYAFWGAVIIVACLCLGLFWLAVFCGQVTPQSPHSFLPF